MALVSDASIVLSVRDYSETSQIVTLMTAANGKVRALAKGSKRPKNYFGGPIDRLQVGQAVFTVRPQGGLGTLTEFGQGEVPGGLRTNLAAFYAASYAAELTLLTTEELDPNPAVFKLLADTLQRLSCGTDSAILVFRFEMRLLRLIGLAPQLGACVACGRSRSPDQGAVFSPAGGGVLCRRCMADGGDEGVAIGPKALKALMFLAEADPEALPRVRLADATATDMRKLLRPWWNHVLDRAPRAMRWVS